MGLEIRYIVEGLEEEYLDNVNNIAFKEDIYLNKKTFKELNIFRERDEILSNEKHIIIINIDK